MDVEGYELECLLGSLKTIKMHNHPPIIFEDWGDKFSWYKEKSKNIFQLLNSLGYSISKLDGRNYLASYQ